VPTHIRLASCQAEPAAKCIVTHLHTQVRGRVSAQQGGQRGAGRAGRAPVRRQQGRHQPLGNCQKKELKYDGCGCVCRERGGGGDGGGGKRII